MKMPSRIRRWVKGASRGISSPSSDFFFHCDFWFSRIMKVMES